VRETAGEAKKRRTVVIMGMLMLTPLSPAAASQRIAELQKTSPKLIKAW